MKAVVDHLNLLKEPITLCFSYYENVPAKDSDVIIKHFHVLDSIIIETRPLSPDEFSKLIDESHKAAISFLTNFYYDNIESQSKLQAIYNDLNPLLTEITANYQLINTNKWNFQCSKRVSLHVQTATETCRDTGDTYPFYEGFNVKDLTFEGHYQILRTLNELAKNEKKHLDSIMSLLRIYDNKPRKKVFDKIPDLVLKDIYKHFSKYLIYGTEKEFLAAVNNREQIKINESDKTHIAYLFHSVLKAEKIKDRTNFLIDLFEVRNKSREGLKDRLILQEIDAYLAKYDAKSQP